MPRQYSHESDATDVGRLRSIDSGIAYSAEIENDLEERGLIVQSDQPYAELTPAGRALAYPGVWRREQDETTGRSRWEHRAR